MMGNDKPTRKQEAQKLKDDAEVLEELVADHGTDWVLRDLPTNLILDYLLKNRDIGMPVNLEECFYSLEAEHYPQDIVEVLRDNQQQPWLTPTPGPDPEP